MDDDIFYSQEELAQQALQKQVAESTLTEEEANMALSEHVGPLVEEKRAYNRAVPAKKPVGAPWSPLRRARFNATLKAKKGGKTSEYNENRRERYAAKARAKYAADKKLAAKAQAAPASQAALLMNGSAPLPMPLPVLQTALIRQLEELQRNEDQLGLCSNIHPKLYEHAFNLARLALVQMKVIETSRA